MSSVRLGVLGSMTAMVDQRAVTLGGARQRAVLAVLLIARGQLVSQDAVIDRVWGDAGGSSPATLHSYVAALRRALEPGRTARQAAQVLVREGSGYALRLPSGAVDADRFSGLAARGEQLLREAASDRACIVLAEALRLWRGDAYADVAGCRFAAPEIARLHGLRLTAQENLFTAELACGRHAAVLGDLERHVAEQPLSERGWELLALALYRAGRQGDALGCLRTARRVLADELGVDPGPALRRLESALLVQDEAALAPARVTATPTPPLVASCRPSNLPLALTGMIGRLGAAARVATLVGEHRLVTLTGPGGIGKTRLSLEVARDRADEDGPWLVELADLAEPDPGLIAAIIADVLGVREAVTVSRLADVLGDRAAMLVLDNCEHLREAVAEAAAELLSRCGGLRLLATSREPLNVPGEVVYEVPPLTPDEGRSLFFARAATALPDWRPTDHDRAAAGRISAELDGLPLAIELAAAQCRVLSVDQIARALDDPFTVLVGGPGPTPERHRALQAAVQWSYRLLQPGERDLFLRLSVFAGGFDLDAATAVGGTAVLADLGALVRKSLVTTEPGTSPRRYRLLETLKQFARRSAGPAVLNDARTAHRAWVLARAQAAGELLVGIHASRATEQIQQDQPEIRLAFNSAMLAGDGTYALRLAGALTRFWYRAGHATEGIGWLTAALDLGIAAAPPLRAPVLIGVCALRYLTGDFTAAARAAGEAVEAAGEPAVEAQARSFHALFTTLRGRPDTLAEAEAAVRLAQGTGLPWLEAETSMTLGMLLRLTGETRRSREVLSRSLAMSDACGHRFVQASASWLIMKIDIDAGRADEALRAGLATLRLMAEDRDDTGWLVVAHTTAAALALVGRPVEAAMLLGIVARRGDAIGFSPVLMDPVDGPRQLAQVRDAQTPAEFAHWCHQGKGLSPAQLSDMLSRVTPRR